MIGCVEARGSSSSQSSASHPIKKEAAPKGGPSLGRKRPRRAATSVRYSRCCAAPEAAQKTPQAELYVAHLGLQLLARDQQRPNLLGGRRLAVDRPEPAHAQQLRDAPRASLRSVLTIIAESAAFTCLVSSSTAL